MSHWPETEYRRLRPYLGTYVEVRVRGLAKAVAISAINQAFEAIATVEQLISAHDRRSDLGRIFDANDTTAVHPWTFEVIEAAQVLYRLSHGVFDASVGAILERQGSLPLWSKTRGRQDTGTMADVELLDKPRLRCHQPLRLDLGGIAKGFAVDRAVDVLIRAGAKAGGVNAGGDFRIFGANDEPLIIRDPAAPQRLLCAGKIQSGAVATSSGYFHRRLQDCRPASPYIDPRTGTALDLRDSVTVIAPSAMWADALTKVLAVDRQIGQTLLSRFHAEAFRLRDVDRPPNLDTF